MDKESLKEKPELLLIGDVDSDMTAKTVKYINHIKKCKAGPVQVILSTTGGYVIDALAIYDLLKSLPDVVHIHCVGACMSSGTIILGAADYRTASVNTQFLVHYGEEYNDSEDASKHNRIVNKITKNIISEYTGKSIRTINSWHRLQKYFLADQAKKLGFIHEIE